MSFEQATGTSPNFLMGGGEMGKLIREKDWAATPLGNPEYWPESLKLSVRICLDSRFPIVLWWGPELRLIYNDAWRPSLGNTKHPWALGTPAKEVWAEIWDIIGPPMLEKVLQTGEATWEKDQLLLLERFGYIEESYWTYSYSAIRLPSGDVGGVFAAVNETTVSVLGERQLKTLRDLSKSILECKSLDEVYEKTAISLLDNPQDFPFALIYCTEEDGSTKLKATLPSKDENFFSHLWTQSGAQQKLTDLAAKAMSSHKIQVVPNISDYLGTVPAMLWGLKPTEALLVPIGQSGQSKELGFMIVGLSPYLQLTDSYRDFFGLVADQIATALANVKSFEEAQKKATALAELDRAKTTFFSNISHEFRTPLTLMLGPVEDALNDLQTLPENRIRLSLIQRNGLRLQKLVNTLLDFSRIEAGRVQGQFSRVDICAFTQDLVSTFRSAVENAGMSLTVSCGAISDNVYVDKDMWEKIVLNLLSNAFKYTNEGGISVQMEETESCFQLSVSDTGVGIAETGLERIFERFHRVENMGGRSQEGTGIGLALVKELVKLHGGKIEVESKLGKGTTFTVSIPVGKEHLDSVIEEAADMRISTQSEAYVQEALKWNPESNHAMGMEAINQTALAATPSLSKKYKVLLADDNADMRHYIQTLLSPSFEVIAATNGEDAFEKITHHHPNLLLTDIMMPRLDGFGLLQRIRETPSLQHLPVIFLSARAGEEAKIEGLQAGADDYIVKPFTAKELIARVEAQLKIRDVRDKTLRDLYHLVNEVPFCVMVLTGEALNVEFINECQLSVWGKSTGDLIAKPLMAALPENWRVAIPAFLKVYQSGERVREEELEIVFEVEGKVTTRWFTLVIDPLRNNQENVGGIIATTIETTDQVLARKKVEESEAFAREALESSPDCVKILSPEGDITYMNRNGLCLLEIDKFSTVQNRPWQDLWGKENHALVSDALHTARMGQQGRFTASSNTAKGTSKWWDVVVSPVLDSKKNVTQIISVSRDISESVAARRTLEENEMRLQERVMERTAELANTNNALQKANKELRRSNQSLEEFAYAASHDMKEPIRKIQLFISKLKSQTALRFDESDSMLFSRIENSVKRMGNLVDDLLLYSYVSDRPLEKVAVDLNEALRQVLDDLEVEIDEKKAGIFTGDLPTVPGYPRQLQQLLQNLISNAIKFAKPGFAPEVTLSNSRVQKGEMEYHCISISDHGIGFSQEYAHQIFKLFSRLHTKEEYTGTGIGLSIVKKVVDNHDGHIEAESTLGKGATFKVYLPV